MRKSKNGDYTAFVGKIKRQSGSKTMLPYLPIPNDNQRLPQGPIYKILQESLLEEGCPIAAKYFSKLVAKEKYLSQTDVHFKRHVRDTRCLLLAIVDNVKSAEFGFRMNGDVELLLKLLIQTVHMIQAQDDAFHWLVKELYFIILRISEKWEDDYPEIVSRMRFQYGVVLTEKGDDLLDEAIIQMSRSLDKCKGSMWYTNDRDRNILREDVCLKLCETHLRQAKVETKSDPKKAAASAYKAVLAFKEGGISGNTKLYCTATLRQSEYLIAGGEFDDAFTILNNLQSHIMAEDDPRNMCEFCFWLGVCYYKLFTLRLALRKFKLSLSLSEKYNLADLKAQTLMNMGRIYAQNVSTQAEARQHFIEAKELFQRLRDFKNEKLARFLIAELKVYQLFPNYIELIRRASWSGFCYLFDLIQWKQKLLPFWNESGELHLYEDEYQCLLQEDLPTDSIGSS